MKKYIFLFSQKILKNIRSLFRNMRLDIKFSLMGLGSVMITAVALVILAVWQTNQFNKLAQKEVDILIDSDLDHITQGIYNLVRSQNEAVQKHIDNNLNVASHILAEKGKIRLSAKTMDWTAINQFTHKSGIIKLPRFYIGKTWIKKNTNMAVNTSVVDKITGLIGETTTIFQRMNEKADMLRIATTVETSSNKRAISTYIPASNPDGTNNPVIYTILNGKTYHGRAYVVNAWYLTAYEPLKDITGNLVGMLYVGSKQEAVVSRLRQAILKIRLGKTGYVFILEGSGQDRGRYIISYKGERDGENIWMSTDSDGHYVIQEIINKSVALKSEEMTTIRYRWQNPGEQKPRWKIARIAYYEPWDWVIGTSVYEDELSTYQEKLESSRFRMTRVMSIAGILIAGLVVMAGIFLTWSIIRPVRRMTGLVEKIIDGDLNQNLEIKSNDEIGVLARTFNIMTGKLNQLMEGLRESEEKYRLIFENALEGLFQVTLDGAFINANPAMARILGYDSPGQLIQSVTDIRNQLYVNPYDRDRLLSAINKTGSFFGFEVRFYRRDRTIIWVSASSRIVKNNSGEPVFLEGFITDITDRKHAEEALAESRNYLDEIINSVADPLFVKDSSHRWVLVNDAMCDFLGHIRGELLGRTDHDFLPKEEADVFWSKDELVLSTGQENINEEPLTDNKGIVHTVMTKKTLYTDKNEDKYIVGIARDITDLKQAEKEKIRLEARLTQAQKMEAIGTLAGGIAHDFNNILAVIIGYSELAMLGIRENDEVRDQLKEVLNAGNRARELVKQILAFSRMTEAEYLPIELKIIVKESLKMLRSVIPSNIEIIQNLSASGLVMSDPVQINQIMINLCTNAVHAIDKTGGIIKIGLHEAVVDESTAQDIPGLSPGKYFQLTIQDTGKGIPPEIMAKIFEPYFTTKGPGQGTGLGLSVIHGIVKSHNGAITVSSTLNKGTTFTVYFPAIKSGSRENGPEEEELLHSGNERILFIDDEKILTNLAAESLGNQGYSVITMTSSIDALKLFRQDPQRFDIVITDMTMPGMTGDRLAQELIKIRHDIPVILCTGYNEHISEEKAKEIGVKEFILKPINIKKLTGSIRKVLDKTTDV